MRLACASGALLALALCWASPSTAGQADGMATGAATLVPKGHRDLCRRDPVECLASGSAGAERLTPDLLRKIRSVNVQVNAATRPASDLETRGVEEFWSYPTAEGSGDCEDYALLKRRVLSQNGIHASNLLLTVVHRSDGTGHAVLTVVTTGGDFVMDNLSDRVDDWGSSDYVFVKRQDGVDPSRWVSIQDRTDRPMASLPPGTSTTR